MNNLITATLLCILLCGVFAGDNSCSIPLASQTQIKSGIKILTQIKLVYKLKELAITQQLLIILIKNNLVLPLPLLLVFSTFIIGINGFDFNPSDVAGI